MAKVVVLGGGYAGLACLIELSKKAPELELYLVDAKAEHCKITNLHKTFVTPVDDYQVPYAQLADKYNFTFHQQRIDFNLADLVCWQQEKTLPLSGGELTFDWLVISTGATPVLPPEWRDGLNQETLILGQGGRLFEELSSRKTEEAVSLSLVGGGATGIQILFELHEQLRKRKIPNQLRLIDLNSRLVPTLPEGIHRYIARKLRREGIEYLPETRCLRQQEGQVLLAERETDRQFSLRSDLSLYFPGVKRSPFSVKTNAYGQVINKEQNLPAIFSAGDSSSFDSNGLNLLTAQAAVRKGKLVAHNIHNLSADRGLLSYRYQERGYLLSLGAIDAIGWLGLRCNLVKGFPATVLKEAMESQYNLFLDGVDTYFP